jgi:hypothetical protein
MRQPPEGEMLAKAWVAAFLIFVAMLIVKDGRVLRGVGMIGSCSVYATAIDGMQWETCKPGKLEGWPDLSSRGCRSQGVSGRFELWQCPASLVSAPAGV